MALVALVLVCASALAGLRWTLEARRFELTHKNIERDEALTAFEPRLRSMEERIKAMEWRVK